jgi:HlyD family secretion protein
MKQLIAFLVLINLAACNSNNDKADGYGNFEATEVTISAEANGKINYLQIEEGSTLEPNTQVGLIDTIQLYLNKQQLIATKTTIASKSTNVLSQKAIFIEQLKTTLIEQKRIQNMFAENAATQRQVDEINGKVNVLNEQIKSVITQDAPISNEVKSIDIQIKKINDQIEKSKIINPIKGTVLAKYTEPNEVTSFGKPLYKIADISEMTLRVFISEKQLNQIKVGQKVPVRIDSQEGMRVKNDGSLKIGMPAEMWIK